MVALIVGFIIAGVLMIAEYLLCTKLKSPLWGGIIPLLLLAAFMFLLVGRYPLKQDLCSHLLS